LGNPDPWQEGRGREEKMEKLKTLLDLVERCGGVAAGYEGHLVPRPEEFLREVNLTGDYRYEVVILPKGSLGLFGALKTLSAGCRDLLKKYLMSRLQERG